MNVILVLGIVFFLFQSKKEGYTCDNPNGNTCSAPQKRASSKDSWGCVLSGTVKDTAKHGSGSQFNTDYYQGRKEVANSICHKGESPTSSSGCSAKTSALKNEYPSDSDYKYAVCKYKTYQDACCSKTERSCAKKDCTRDAKVLKGNPPKCNGSTGPCSEKICCDGTKCPTNSTYDGRGAGGCICDIGTEGAITWSAKVGKYTGTCQKKHPACSRNKRITSQQGTCTCGNEPCMVGQFCSNNQCLSHDCNRVKCPYNSHKLKSGCPRKQNCGKNECCSTCPSNSTYDDAGPGTCKCDANYTGTITLGLVQGRRELRGPNKYVGSCKKVPKVPKVPTVPTGSTGSTQVCTCINGTPETNKVKCTASPSLCAKCNGGYTLSTDKKKCTLDCGFFESESTPSTGVPPTCETNWIMVIGLLVIIALILGGIYMATK